MSELDDLVRTVGDWTLLDDLVRMAGDWTLLDDLCAAVSRALPDRAGVRATAGAIPPAHEH